MTEGFHSAADPAHARAGSAGGPESSEPQAEQSPTREQPEGATPVGEEPQAAVGQPDGETVADNGLGDDLTKAQADVESLTGDLQRLQAEYLNYKRRVERDRELVRENASYAVLAPITDVLDTIDRARDAGPLEDGLRAVADQLERVVTGLGLSKFGEPGDVFDPTRHEALSHLGTDPEVEETTVKMVAKAGYRIGDRVVRAAQVLVVDPAEG
ncbi:MAG: nucleotide exchange factor GrpE [Nocardioides sp.]|uniref:nucleotide exchange factor GrpE n=1 Tax=Nocardioides sp. TaxID=35761 RepID=UPI0039E435B9